MNILKAWGKFLADASGTRQQITLVVLIAWGLAVRRGIELAKSAKDIEGLLVAMTPVVIATLGAWFAGKWLLQNTDK